MDKFQIKIMEDAIFNNTVTTEQLAIFCDYYDIELIKNKYNLDLIHIKLLQIAQQKENPGHIVDRYILWVNLYKKAAEGKYTNGQISI